MGTAALDGGVCSWYNTTLLLLGSINGIDLCLTSGGPDRDRLDGRLGVWPVAVECSR